MNGVDTEEKSSGEQRYRRMRWEYVRAWRSLMLRLGVFAGTWIILFTWVFGVVVIRSDDMRPALREGDIALYDRLTDPVRSDVVVFRREGRCRVSRVEGLPGSVIGSTPDGMVTIDGIFLPVDPDRGIYEKTMCCADDSKLGDRMSARSDVSRDRSFVLRPEEYYVLGDRRSECEDSRTYGPVPRRDIRGRIFAVWRQRGI